MEDLASFGWWLKQRRKTLDLTQADLARCVGCAMVTIQKIEADERRPSRQMAELLADCLEISPADRPTFLKIARAELRVDRLAELSPASLPPLPTELGRMTDTETHSSTSLPPLDVPTPLTPLIGREHELAEITRLLQQPQCRLLSLIGLGGIGKTRLAIEAASCQRQAFADGIYFVPLGPISAGEFIVPTIADAIGFSFSGPTDSQVQLLNYLREKQLLLILDNLEHLLPPQEKGPGVEVITHLLQHTPALKLLTTSRERLSLQGEWVFEIQGLPVPPSDQAHELEKYSAALLFLQSAQRAQIGFVLSPEERPAVAHLCRLMAGIPLGIELAAAWVRSLSCQEIVRETERSLDFLAVSMRDVPARHRSMRAVFDHSWKLLSTEEQQVMRQLSVFRGGFRREAAEVVAGAMLPLLSALVDKSLLRRTEAGRYDLHELVRQYATAQLHSDPQAEARTHACYAGYYAALLQQWEEQLRSPKQPQILAEMGIEIDNLRLAWGWMVAHQETANIQKSLRSLCRFHEIRGRFQEGAAFFRQAGEVLQSPGEAGAEQDADAKHSVVLGQVLAQQGYFYAHLGQHEQARELLQKSLTLLRSGTEEAALADTLAYLGYMKYRLGEFEEASQYTQESLILNRRLGNQVGVVFCLSTLTYICLAHEEYEKAYRLSQESLTISRDVGDPRGTAHCLITFSAPASLLGRYAEAKQRAQESLEISQELNDRWGVGRALRRLGLISLDLGEAGQAELLLRQSVSQFREIGDRPLMAVTLIELGNATRALEAFQESRQHFLEALRTGIETETFGFALRALTELAALHMQEGTIESGVELLAHVLQHPASTPETKTRAKQLWTELESRLAPKQFEVAQTQARNFETVVQELLLQGI
jgi:predicted ATPase/transcriptional regulator with XRE-family HTH domain